MRANCCASGFILKGRRSLRRMATSFMPVRLRLTRFIVSGRATRLFTSVLRHGAGDAAVADGRRSLRSEAGVQPVLPEPLDGVEATVRVSPEGNALLYLLNHNENSSTRSLA